MARICPACSSRYEDEIADSPQVVKAALQADASAKVAVAKAGGDSPAGHFDSDRRSVELEG